MIPLYIYLICCTASPFSLAIARVEIRTERISHIWAKTLERMRRSHLLLILNQLWKLLRDCFLHPISSQISIQSLIMEQRPLSSPFEPLYSKQRLQLFSEFLHSSVLPFTGDQWSWENRVKLFFFLPPTHFSWEWSQNAALQNHIVNMTIATSVH